MKKFMQVIQRWLTPEEKRGESNGQQPIDDQASLVYGKMLRKEIPGTPFHVMGDEQTGYALTIGMNRLSPMCKEIKGVEQWLEENEWNVIMTMIIMIMDGRNDVGKAVQESLGKSNRELYNENPIETK